MKVLMYPSANPNDEGLGGINRVALALEEGLARRGIELVNTVPAADVVGCHVQFPKEWPAQWPDKGYILHCHGLYWAEYEWPHGEQLANDAILWSAKIADAITVPSEWVGNVIRRHLGRVPVVIPHGVYLDEWTPPAQHGDYVWWDKGRTDAICDPGPMNAAAALLPDLRFVSTFGTVAPNVTITGKLTYEKAAATTRAAGVYLATSRETFGIATLQAAAAGVPVVGYRWGGQEEFIPAALLAEPGDVEGLAQRIRAAFELRDKLSPKMREIAARFTWDNALDRYADLYYDVADRRAARRFNPRTSIVVTAYKLAEYLPACLDSVLAQTDPDWECVIVDDASPDASGDIAEQYGARDERFKVVHNATNQYLAEARNIGIAQARGRYLLPLDADDMLAPSAVAELAKHLDADRTTAVAYGNVLFINEAGQLEQYSDQQGRPYPPGHSGWPIAEFRVDWQVNRRNLLPYCSMFRREAWENTGGYRRRLRTAEDADFWARLGSFGYRPRYVTKNDTLIYRNRAGSMSRSEAEVDWGRWFPWRLESTPSPAGAFDSGASLQSLDPPAISVIIPVGPGHEFLVRDAIDSVLAQTLTWWECVVVNDTGKPLALMPAWVKVIDTLGGIGAAAARNAGIAASRAAHYLPLDADDLLEPTALERLWKAHRERPGVIIYSDFFEDPEVHGKYAIYRTPDFDERRLIGGGAISPVTMLIPKAAWEAVGGYDPEMPWEDWVFHISICKAG